MAAVVFDEFHERSLASDLALAMVRQVQQSVRPELRIVVMSATLAAEPIAAYLGDCPIVESLGRTYPVEIQYQATLDRQPLADSVADGVTQVLDRTAGDCLVFLPGLGEIRQCEKRLAVTGRCQRIGATSALWRPAGGAAGRRSAAWLAAKGHSGDERRGDLAHDRWRDSGRR